MASFGEKLTISIKRYYYVNDNAPTCQCYVTVQVPGGPFPRFVFSMENTSYFSS